MFIARESGRSLTETDLPDELAISVITIGELRAGVLAVVHVEMRDRRLATLSEALALDPCPSTRRSLRLGRGLHVLLRDMQERMPVNDSWIAATAISLGVPVVTQDEDYVEVPGSRSSEFELVGSQSLSWTCPGTIDGVRTKGPEALGELKGSAEQLGESA